MRSGFLPWFFLCAAWGQAHPPATSYGRIPIAFEPNRGQFSAEVRYAARHGSQVTLLMDTRAAVVFHARRASGKAPVPVLLKFAGAARPAAIEPLERLPGVSNYYLGADPAQWVTGVPQYSGVRFREVYPGIDVVYHGANQSLEYDFVLRPGADAGRIEVEFEGAAGAAVSAAGELVLETAAGPVTWRPPVAYQEAGGVRRKVRAAYRATSGGRFGFQVGAYDRGRPLVIDPQIVYSSTFPGGEARCVSVDASGNAIIAGVIQSPDFPLVPAQSFSSPGWSTMVAKVDAQGTALLYSTFIGSGVSASGRTNVNDGTYALATDREGNAYITGGACTSSYPVVSASAPFQAKPAGNCDAYVAKLDAAKGTLVYATYLGGADFDQGRGIAVDAAGVAYVTGETSSADFPTKNALQDKYAGMGDVFVARLSADGSALLTSTYLGGAARDMVRGLVLDGAGNPVVAGHTQSLNFPVMAAYRSERAGDPKTTTSDIFVTKLNPAADALLFSTYYGGTINEVVGGLTVDAAGAIYVTGTTTSPNFLTVPYDPTKSPSYNDCELFLVRFAGGSHALDLSLLFGGTSCDHPGAVVTDAAGRVYVSGVAFSPDMPVINPIQAARSGTSDAFLMEFDMPSARMVWSTYLGGEGGEEETRSWSLLDYLGPAVAIDGRGDLYLVGQTYGGSFPTANPIYRWDTDYFSGAFISKITGVGAMCTDVSLGGDALPEYVGASGGTYNVTFTSSPANCNWGASADAKWMKLTTASAGTGDGSLTLQVTPNADTEQRTGKLTIAGKSVVITQDAP